VTRLFLIGLVLLSFCCASSRSAESQTDATKVRDTDVVRTVQTGPETVTTTIDTYLPPLCKEGDVLWPDGTGGFYCGSAPAKEPVHQSPQAEGSDAPDHKEGGANKPVHEKLVQSQKPVEHGLLLSHEVIVDQKGPVVSTTEAKGQTQTKADTKTETSKSTRWGPGPLGWALIALAVLAAGFAVVRFKLWTLILP